MGVSCDLQTNEGIELIHAVVASDFLYFPFSFSKLVKLVCRRVLFSSKTDYFSDTGIFLQTALHNTVEE